MARASFTLEDEADEWVESRLIPSQPKAAWYRYSVKTIMQVDAQLDELYQPYEYQKRQEFVEAAVREKIDSVKANEADLSHGNIVGDMGEE